MNKEDIIIAMLEKQSTQFEKIDERFEKIDQRFEKVDKRFEKMDKRLENLEQNSQHHSTQLTEHSQILKALLSGQEHLKADLDGFKISTGKAFEKLYEKVDTLTINHEIVRNDTHTNKVDIERIKKTMGMA